jgi:hypothetical protein
MHVRRVFCVVWCIANAGATYVSIMMTMSSMISFGSLGYCHGEMHGGVRIGTHAFQYKWQC